MSTSTKLPGKGDIYEDQTGRTWFIAAGDEVPDGSANQFPGVEVSAVWKKVQHSKPLPGEALDPNNPNGTVAQATEVKDVDELEQRIAELEARLEEVEPQDPPAELLARIDALEAVVTDGPPPATPADAAKTTPQGKPAAGAKTPPPKA